MEKKYILPLVKESRVTPEFCIKQKYSSRLKVRKRKKISSDKGKLKNISPTDLFKRKF